MILDFDLGSPIADPWLQWVKKTSGETPENSCEFKAPCADLGVVEGGAWQCNKKVTSCKLTCPHYDPNEARIFRSC